MSRPTARSVGSTPQGSFSTQPNWYWTSARVQNVYVEPVGRVVEEPV